MSTGATNWRNLYAYYKKQLKGLSRNSPIRAQVQRQIANIEMVAEANGISLAGGTAPARITEAEPGVRRYEDESFLTSDVDAAINDQILYLMATRNGIYPEGERPLESYVGRMLYEGTVEELRAGMIADSKLQELILEEIKNGATVVRDPATGVYHEVDSTFVLDVIHQYGENMLARAGLERGLVNGNFEDVMQTWEGVQDTLIAPIITNRVMPVEGVTKPNGEEYAGINGYLDDRLTAFNALKNTALSSSDPVDMMRQLARAGRFLRSSVGEVQAFIDNRPEGFEVEEFIPTDIEYSVKLADLLVNAPNMSFDELGQAGSDLIAAHPEGYFLSEGDVADLLGTPAEEVGAGSGRGTIDDRVANMLGEDAGGTASSETRVSPGWSGLMGARAAQDGIAVTTQLRTTGELAVGVERYVYVAAFGTSAPVAVPESQAAAYLAAINGNPLFEDGGLSTGAFPSIEKVRLPNGRMQETIVWREMQAPTPEEISWWVNEDGKWATQEQAAKFGQNRALAADEGWVRQPFAGLERLNLLQGANGQRYYVDTETGQAYTTPPIGLDVGFDFAPTDLINSDGSVKEGYGKSGTANALNGMFFLRGSNVDFKTASAMALRALEQGEIDINQFTWVNEQGVPLDTPSLAQIQEHFDIQYQESGARYSDIVSARDRNARQFIRESRAEQTRARAARRQYLANAQQSGALQREGGAERFANVVENSVEIGRRMSGIHFGANAEKRPRMFAAEDAPTAQDIVRTTLPPVTIDQVRPMSAAESLAAVRVEQPTPPPTSPEVNAATGFTMAPNKPPATKKKPAPTKPPKTKPKRGFRPT